MLARARALDRLKAPPDVLRPQTLERGNGRASLHLHRCDGATRLAGLYQKAPLRLLFPRGERGFPMTAVLVTTSGGIAGGDRLAVEIDCAAGSEATLVGQAAEKLYRSTGADAGISTALSVAAGARLEWLPQETILFDRARLVRQTDIALAGDARLLAVDQLTFGRLARGERFAEGRLLDRWRVRIDGRLAWVEQLRLDGDVAGRLDRRFGFAGAEASAMLLFRGPEADGLLPQVRDAMTDGNCRAGAGLVNGLLLARLLGPATAVRNLLARLVGLLRAAAFGLPAAAPRVWAC